MAVEIFNNNDDGQKSLKKLQGSQDEVQKPIKQLVFGEYFNIHTFLMHPITMRFIEQEAKRLREWAQTDSARRLSDFIDNAGYSPEIFSRWCRQYPILKLAQEYAMRRIGARREDGAIDRKFDASMIQRTLGFYDPIWKAETIQLAQLKNDNAEKNETKIVVMDSYQLANMIQAQEPIEEVVISNRSPEDVAGKLHRATKNERRVYEPGRTIKMPAGFKKAAKERNQRKKESNEK